MTPIVLTGSVGINQFVTRQTEKSQFSYCVMDFEWLRDRTQKRLHIASPGDKPGSYLVQIPSVDGDGELLFYNGVVNLAKLDKKPYVATGKLDAKALLDSPVLLTTYEPRVGSVNEEPYVQTVCKGVKKQPARYAWCVIYEKSILGDYASTDADYEIVALEVNDEPFIPPCHPVTMMRNQLELPGGTKAMYTSEQWAKAVKYWMDRVMWGGE